MGKHMSRHHHAYSESETLEHDAQTMSARDLEKYYGIQFIENPDVKAGIVFDTVSQREFPSLGDWMAVQLQEFQWSDTEHLGTSRKYDEEF